MLETVAGALITGVLTLVGVRICSSTTGMREHNGFARRMPVVEEQIRVINHRISDLERAQE